ncbi:hypothetical protein [Nocardia sp. NPDC050175]|uniref:hypothetical protein n=1 Tax=Nocardia sp. NPDC050175 TaxID=3364317 RepID=UPI003791D8CD
MSESALHHLEELMTTGYENKSDFARMYVAEGRAEVEAAGVARMVLEALDIRGIPVSDEVRARISSCTDVDQLGIWHRRAVLADSANEAFALSADDLYI